MSERPESKELDPKEKEKQEDKKIENADKLLKQDGKDKEVSDIAAKAGNSLYLDIAASRNDQVGSGGRSEKAEFQDQAKPMVAKYEEEVKAASLIKDPEDRKKAIEKAYLSLRDELEGIKGTQEARDAKGDTDRQGDSKKTAEDKDRKRTLEFSDAMLKAAKEIDIERRLADFASRVKDRMELANQTKNEAVVSAETANKELSMMA